MGVLEDVRNWLKEVPLWKELQNVPERVTALERRLADLETELKRRPAPEVCPMCFKELKLEAVEQHWSGSTEFQRFKCHTPGCSYPGRTKTVENK